MISIKKHRNIFFSKFRDTEGYYGELKPHSNEKHKVILK